VQMLDIDDGPRAARYLERLERDDLDERSLSRRLLNALAAILGTDSDEIAPRPPRLAVAQALFRADGPSGDSLARDIDALSRAAWSPASAPPMDELDRLFLGGLSA